MPACDYRLCFIAERLNCPEPLPIRAAKLFDAGVGQVILREKDLPEKELLALAKPIKEAADSFGARLIVNSSLSVALKIQAFGLHLPFALFAKEKTLIAKAKDKGLTVGVSIHTFKEAAEAFEAGADQILIGPIFPTGCKPGAYGKGLDFIEVVGMKFPTPIWAVGGIGPENLKQVFLAGAKVAAIRSGFTRALDPAAFAEKCLRCLSKAKEIQG
jgi:thiamine-phosphate pyrophosphorylase